MSQLREALDTLQPEFTTWLAGVAALFLWAWLAHLIRERRK